jgi:hypothetical protein
LQYFRFLAVLHHYGEAFVSFFSYEMVCIRCSLYQRFHYWDETWLHYSLESLEHVSEGHQRDSGHSRSQWISVLAEGSNEALEWVASLQYYALVVLANPSDDVAGFELVKPVFAVYALVLGEGFLVLLFGFV